MARTSEYAQFSERDPETGQVQYICPECVEEPVILKSLARFKSHMQSEHGGLIVDPPAADEESAVGGSTIADAADADGEGSESGRHTRPSPAPPPSPEPVKRKKLSSRSRELNEKVNRCARLIIKKLKSGWTDAEESEYDGLQGDITEAVLGIEVDFDAGPVGPRISGKVALLLIVVLLWIAPSLPSMKDVLDKIRAASAAKRAKKELAN